MRWQKKAHLLVNDLHVHVLFESLVKSSIVGGLVDLTDAVVTSILGSNLSLIVLAPASAAGYQFSFLSLVTNETGTTILV